MYININNANNRLYTPVIHERILNSTIGFETRAGKKSFFIKEWPLIKKKSLFYQNPENRYFVTTNVIIAKDQLMLTFRQELDGKRNTHEVSKDHASDNPERYALFTRKSLAHPSFSKCSHITNRTHR